MRENGGCWRGWRRPRRSRRVTAAAADAATTAGEDVVAAGLYTGCVAGAIWR